MRHTVVSLCAGPLLASIMLVAPPLTAQAVHQRTRQELKASYDAHQGDFDYLLGDWEFTSASREFGTGRGYWSAVRLAEGAQILDEYRVVGDSGQTWYVTNTLRAYNANLDQWELVSTEPGNGLQNLGTGRRDAHRPAVRRGNSKPVAVAHPVLRHPPGSFLLVGRPLDGRRQDVDSELAAHRGATHRAIAVHGSARTRQEMSYYSSGASTSAPRTGSGPSPSVDRGVAQTAPQRRFSLPMGAWHVLQ